MKQGALIFDEQTDRYDIRFDLADYYAIDFPQRVMSLVLIAPQYDMPKFLLRVQNLVFKFMPKSQFQNIGLTKNDFITLTNSMVNMDFTKDIEKIFCPVLVLCGEKDNVNKTVAVKLTERLPRAKFITINNSKHEVNLDNPNELAKAIKEYIIEDEEFVCVECEKTSGLLN